MEQLKIETIQRVELTDLVMFISKAKGISYPEAEGMVPDYIINHDGFFNVNYEEGDWCKELKEYLTARGIVSIFVYQDE